MRRLTLRSLSYRIIDFDDATGCLRKLASGLDADISSPGQHNRNRHQHVPSGRPQVLDDEIWKSEVSIGSGMESVVLSTLPSVHSYAMRTCRQDT